MTNDIFLFWKGHLVPIMFKRIDLLIIIVVAVFGLSLLIVNFLNIFYLNYKGNKVLTIYKDGKLEKTFNFSEEFNKTYTINTKYGYNILEIKNGEAYIKDADCESKLCIAKGKINSIGDLIICLPHKLVIQIEGENQIDAVSY
jgi:hypothetical protein